MKKLALLLLLGGCSATREYLAPVWIPVQGGTWTTYKLVTYDEARWVGQQVVDGQVAQKKQDEERETIRVEEMKKILEDMKTQAVSSTVFVPPSAPKKEKKGKK